MLPLVPPMCFGIRPPPSGWFSDQECHSAWRKHTGDARYAKVARHGINLYNRLVVSQFERFSFLRVRDGKRINILTTMLIPPGFLPIWNGKRLEISTVHCDFKSIVWFHTWPVRIVKRCFRCTKLAHDKTINNQKKSRRFVAVLLHDELKPIGLFV